MYHGFIYDVSHYMCCFSSLEKLSTIYDRKNRFYFEYSLPSLTYSLVGFKFNEKGRGYFPSTFLKLFKEVLSMLVKEICFIDKGHYVLGLFPWCIMYLLRTLF